MTSCNYSNDKRNSISKIDSTKVTYSADTLQQVDKVSFKHISDVIDYAKPGTWINIQDSSSSCALFFNINGSGSDTIDIEYSPECWLSFPYKVSAQKIIVFWDKIIDTKYEFNIVKSVNSIEKKYKGKPFMILQLINDTTLQATYPIPEIIKRLNSSDKDRLLFPDNYVFTQTFL